MNNEIKKKESNPVWKLFWKKRAIRYPVLIFLFPVVLFLLLLLADRVIMPIVVHWGEAAEVPDLTDLNLEEAEKVLKKKGLKLQILTEEHDATRPPGTVLSQIPGPNTKVREGRLVKVTVSKGGKMVLVPKLEGISIRQAELLLAHEGLKLGDVSWQVSDSFPEDVVISTTPSSETSVPHNMSINLKVSLGSKPGMAEVPNLLGMNLEESKKILREIGLQLGKIKETVKEEFLPGTIMNQSLPPGQEVKRGSKINLEVSATE